MNRTFEQPVPRSREELSLALRSDDPKIVSEALISAALHEPDRQFVESLIVQFLKHPDPLVRGVSATAAGHFARIHRVPVAHIIPLLQALLRDPRTSGKAQDALDDIAMFTGQSA